MKPKAPSEKRLIEAFRCDPETAKAVRAVIRNEVPPDSFPQTARWVAQCYNRPATGELKMSALNEILEMSGVECISRAGRYMEAPLVTYLNAGDTYAPTIVRYRGGTYAIASWGDIVESLERRGISIA